MQLRLSQQRVIHVGTRANGTRIETGAGFRDRLNCVRCEASDPGNDAETKKQLGCRLRGLTFEAKSPVRIDYTGDSRRDYVRFCPGAYRDESIKNYIYEAIEIESFGGLSACSRSGVYHLPDRVVQFYLAALGARTRFEAECDDAKSQLMRSS